MKLDTYPLIGSPETATVRFVSQEPRGDIPKIIQFELLSANEETHIYNLAFGDGTDILNDLAVSNNGDAGKASAAEQFLIEHPTAFLFASGSTAARTRLYRIGLTRFQSVIQTKFVLFGILDGGLEPFEPGRPYEAFMAQLISS